MLLFNLYNSTRWALCYFPDLLFTGELFKTPENCLLPRVMDGMAIYLCSVHELLEGRDWGSGHHPITCFLNEQRGCFLPEAEPRDLRVISRQLI